MATPKRLTSRSRSLSASTWNQYADAVTRFNSPENGPAPQPEYTENLAFARTDGDFIPPFTVCRIVARYDLDDSNVTTIGYKVVKVDAQDENGVDIPRNSNYAISGGEGVDTDSGSVYVSGMAIVKVTKDQAVVGSLLSGYDANTPENQYAGEAEASYYAVPDKTIFEDEDIVIGPVGHFRITSWYSAEGQEDAEYLYLCVNMDNHPTTVRVETTEVLSAVGEDEGDFTFSGGNAKVWYRGSEGDDYVSGSLKAKQEDSWDIRVFNITDSEITEGVYGATYSKEYNCIVVLAGSAAPEEAEKIYLTRNESNIAAGQTVDCPVYEVEVDGQYPEKQLDNDIAVTNDWQLDFGVTIPSGVKMLVTKCSDGKYRPISMDASWMLRHTMVTVTNGNSILRVSPLTTGYNPLIPLTTTLPVLREQGYGFSNIGSIFDVSRTGVWLNTLSWDGIDIRQDPTLPSLEFTLRCVDWQGNVLASAQFTSNAVAGNLVASEVTISSSDLSLGAVSFTWEAIRTNGSDSDGATIDFDKLRIRLERISD